MLTLHIPGDEYWDEANNEFITTKDITITIEYSLASISKWEAEWHKPFLNSMTELTIEEICDFIRCMTITQNVDPNIYRVLPKDVIDKALKYMADTRTATTFSTNQPQSHKKEIVTSELVYYWMSALQLPMECQKWHFNRLMTLIRIASEKNQPPKKMSKGEIFRQNKALNAQRRAKFKSRG